MVYAPDPNNHCGSVCHVLVDHEPLLDMNVATFAQLVVLVAWVVVIKVRDSQPHPLQR